MPIDLSKLKNSGGGLPRQHSLKRFLICQITPPLLVVLFSVASVLAQGTPPQATYFRSYVNDVQGQANVTVTVSGTTTVSCFTIEETIPGAATVLSVSGDGVFQPSNSVIRWGPYSNAGSTNVSYRITGLPASYPVNGGSWMDGQYYFSPGVTMVVIPASSNSLPTLPEQVATPVFTPSSGAGVPVSVSITCPTPGASLYYTVDGTLPTQASIPYSDPLNIVLPTTLRAAAFLSGWTSSVASVAYYGYPAPRPENVQVTRTVSNNNSSSPSVTFTVVPGANASCFALTEIVPLGLAATEITAGGNYIAGNNEVVWGPFFGTNVLTLGYTATGQPGSYPVHALWSVDGVGGGESAGTNIVITGLPIVIPTPPQQVAAPVFFPVSGSYLPVSVFITCSTPGSSIRYTIDGSFPTTNSPLYPTNSKTIHFLGFHPTDATTFRAVGFANGWIPSVASFAYYEPAPTPDNVTVTRTVNNNNSTFPSITFNLVPGTNASCVALTESLPQGLTPTEISAGGNYIAGNNEVVWGPFFGTNVLTLSYQAVGQPGTYPVQASWSVDGFGDGESKGTNIVITGLPIVIPTPPQQVAAPVFSPASGAVVPASVSITCPTPGASIYYTMDGTLPTPASMSYSGPLSITSATTFRAAAFLNGWMPSVASVAYYVAFTTNASVGLAHSISGNGSFLPAVTVTATPQASGSCYSVTETIAPGLSPSGFSPGAYWDSIFGVIRWGPFLDHLQRTFSYNVTGPSGAYPLVATTSVDGRSLTNETGATSVQINANNAGPIQTNLATCLTGDLVYNLTIDPAPGVVTVTSATGNIAWGDGSQSAITQPIMSFQKQYTSAGLYMITVSADWTGYTADINTFGHSSKTETNLVVTNCSPPEILIAPSNQVVLVGGTAQFSVSGSSSLPMNYQWFFNRTDQYFSAPALSTLVLPDVELQSAGNYLVVISNTFGSVTSSPAQLTVVAPLITHIGRNSIGGVEMNFVGLPNTRTRLWIATNLTPPVNWVPIFTNTVTSANGTWQYIDTNAFSSARFYKFTTP